MFNSKFSRIIIVICTVIFAGLCFCIAQDHFEENRIAAAREEHYNKVNDSINDLYIRRDFLNEKKEELAANPNYDISGLSSFTFVVGDTREGLIDDVKGQLDEQHMKANLVLSPDSFTEREGYIGTDRMKELTDEGWEICISASSAEEVASVVNLLEDNELPKATALLLKDGNESKEITTRAYRLGIRIILAGPENIDRDDTSFTWIPVYGYRNAEDEERITEAVRNSKAVALYISSKAEEEQKTASSYSQEDFANVLELVGGYSKSGACIVTVQSGAAERYKEREEALKRAEDEAGVSIEKIEAEIDEINEQIKAIHEKTY